MTSPIALVTGCDAAYFPLLEGCLRSLREQQPGRRMVLAVLDAGLTLAQRRWVEGIADRVAEPGWDFDFPGREAMPGWFRVLTARPFLPRYLPGHDLYFWLDADAWVQDWAAVALYLQAAETGALAITPEIDRAYRHFYKAGPEFRSVIERSYREAFGEAAAGLVHYPLLNSGALALRADAPHWAAWAAALGEALQRSRDVLVEQAALNYVVYTQDLPARLLPSWCNWICHHALPAWDEAERHYVEPSLPHHRLGILHLTLGTKRVERHEVAAVGAHGAPAGRLAMSLRYEGRGGHAPARGDGAGRPSAGAS